MMRGTARLLIGAGTLCLLSACSPPRPSWDAPPYYSGNPRYDYSGYYEPYPSYETRTYVYSTDGYAHPWEHRPNWQDGD